jgi:tetratricopeptide (TPR) repeat protein
MKKITLALAAFLTFAYADAQQLRTPAASTNQTVKQEFGLGSIELNYSRPSAKGRKVMGDLVPFDKVWRTGANQATVLTFSDDVSIGGKEVKAGKYGLLSIPGSKEWTLIITKDLNVTSPSAYKQENDVVRVKAPVIAMSNKVETFTIQFANISNNACELHLMWENTAVALPVSMDVDGKVMKQIDDAMNKDSRPYYAAASYYYDNGKDLNMAKEWVDKAILANPNAFWMTLLKARIHAKQGDKAGASAACDKTIELATAAKNDDYIKMATELKASLK